MVFCSKSYYRKTNKEHFNKGNLLIKFFFRTTIPLCTMIRFKFIVAALCLGFLMYIIAISTFTKLITLNNYKTNVDKSILTLTPELPPPLYIITPTFRRPEQLAELTRLGYTLKHVKNLLWLVIEDAKEPSPLVVKILRRIQVPWIYLQAPMPAQYQNKKGSKPRGVSNRNMGLKWLRDNIKNDTYNPQMMGVFYFADDDNTYDISLFEEIRYTKKISLFPVGLIAKTGVSSPVLKNGNFIDWYDGWIGKRKYAVDMAGFAVSVSFLFQRPNAKMPFSPGYEEDGFLKSLTPIEPKDIQYLANNCTEILCWHTQTKKNDNPKERDKKYVGTNLDKLTQSLVYKEIIPVPKTKTTVVLKNSSKKKNSKI